jgi:hypothetical protein
MPLRIRPPFFVNCGVCKFLFLYDLAYSLRFVSLTQSTMYGTSQVYGYGAAFQGRASSGGASGSGASGRGLQVCAGAPSSP